MKKHMVHNNDLPVLVASACFMQKTSDLEVADEAWVLMQKALEKAAVKTGVSEVLASIDFIGAPQGLWPYKDPCRLVADAVGSPQAKTCIGSIGVSQQALINKACAEILEGKAQISVVIGGEAKFRELQGKIQGKEIKNTEQDDSVTPDFHWHSKEVLWSDHELSRGLMMPTEFYALMESALSKDLGHTVQEHREHLGKMYQSLSEIAAENDEAWYREPMSSEAIWQANDKNTMLSFPYTKKMNTQWNVNQAAALVFCSESKARELGVPEDQWIYPWVMVESNHVVAMSERPCLYRHAGTEKCGESAYAETGLTPENIDFVDLYSCFPVAVQSHAIDLGLPSEMVKSITGCMTFAGGPLNNYVMMSTAQMADKLVSNPDAKGLVSTISGINGKQGVAIYSHSRPKSFSIIDVTEEARAAMPPVVVNEDYQGEATVLATTVVFANNEPSHAFAVAENAAGERMVCTSRDDEILESLQAKQWVGERIMVGEQGVFTGNI